MEATRDSALVKDRYRLIARLGEGGMGVTFRAWDTQDNLPVVIKMPREDIRSDTLVMERFAREVSTMLALKHEHIVPITDHGEDLGCPFVAMRFLPGGSLTEYRAKETGREANQLPPSSLHFWLPGISDALDFIHANGVLHRDVKPGNIFLDAFLKPFLGDFGIAKVVAESGGLNRESTLTATRMAIGTPEYMGPEIFRGGVTLDGRVDQYALGVIVYELLAGRKPFVGDSAHIIVEHFSKDVPPLRELCPSIPRRSAEAVHRALEKHPEDRFATCQDFADAVLEQVPILTIDTSRARLLCPQCNVILRVSMSSAGRMGTCPRCESALSVAEDLGSLWLKGEDRSSASGGAANSADFVEEESGASLAGDESQVLSRAAGASRQWALVGVTAVVGMLAGLVLGGMGRPREEQKARMLDSSEVDLLRQQLIEKEAALDTTTAQVKQLEVLAHEERERNAVLYRANHELVLQNRRLTAAMAQSPVKDNDTPASTSAPPALEEDTAANAMGAFTNSIGMRFLLVPAGTFAMGSNDVGRGHQAHEVEISSPFYIGVHEVTNEQWEAVMGTSPSEWKAVTLPVAMVSWDDAVTFCKKLSEIPDEKTVRLVYRLPTEAEWEYACRAGTSSPYSFDVRDYLGDYSWFAANSDSQPHPVGQKRPNPWGLYDVHGNVAEWCSDFYGPYPGGRQSDPQGPRFGSQRVYRGGAWKTAAGLHRSCERDGADPSLRLDFLGFRVVMMPFGSP